MYLIFILLLALYSFKYCTPYRCPLIKKKKIIVLHGMQPLSLPPVSLRSSSLKAYFVLTDQFLAVYRGAAPNACELYCLYFLDFVPTGTTAT